MNFKTSSIHRLLLPFIGGLLYASAFPSKFMPSTTIIGAIIGMALLLKELRLFKPETKLKYEILSILFFSLGHCLLGFYWIPETIRIFGSIFFPFNYALGLLFSFFIVPQFYVFIVIFYLGQKFLKNKNLNFYNPKLFLLIAAMTLTLCEYLTPQQFPAHLAHPWLHFAPYIGLAPVIGSVGISFISFLGALTLAFFLHNKKIEWFSLTSFLLLSLLNFAFPLKYENLNRSLGIRFVQPNIGNFLKISSEHGSVSAMSEVYNRYFTLSTRPSEFPLDLIIWPETAWPNLLNSSHLIKSGPKSTPRLFRRIIDKTKAELLFGGYDRSFKFGPDHIERDEFNSSFLMGRNGGLKEVYHKINLIPFGEGLPFGPLNPYLRKYITNISYFAKGEAPIHFKTDKDFYFITPICYEILFSSFIRNALNHLQIHQHDFIINLTNDSWYGDTSEPLQHLFLAHWRALEFNIPILRMTNTGITSILYPDGSESVRTGVYKITTLDQQIKLPTREATIYQQYGLLPLFVLWAILAILSLLLTAFKKRQSPL